MIPSSIIPRLRGAAAAATAALCACGALAGQTVTSAGGVELEIGGRVHAQFASSSVEAGRSADFFIRRARLRADVTVNDLLGGRIQADFAGGEASLKDVYARMDFNPFFQVSIGQFKRSFDPFELASSTELELVERDGRIDGLDVCTGVGGICSFSRFTEGLAYSDRDAGVRVSGEGPEGRYEYQVSLTNGAGTDTEDENDAKSLAGRLVVAVADEVRVGANFSVHDFPAAVDDDDYGTAIGADVEVGGYRDGLHLVAALVGGDNWLSLEPDGDPRRFLTGQILASYYAELQGTMPYLRAVEPVARLSWGDPDRDTDDVSGVLMTPGVFLYVEGRNRIGLNLDVYAPDQGDTELSFKLGTFLYF